MVRSIHHINFLVRDLEAAVKKYEQILDRPVDARDVLEDRGAEIARFRLGETWLCLVQPTRPDTVPARHLAEHGEGFFLLSLGVESLAEESQRLGNDEFSSEVRKGLDDWQVRDLDLSKTFGAQLQFVVTSPQKPGE